MFFNVQFTLNMKNTLNHKKNFSRESLFGEKSENALKKVKALRLGILHEFKLIACSRKTVTFETLTE